MSIQPKEIFLSDYTQPKYWIKNTNLTFELNGDDTTVKAKLKFERNSKSSDEKLFLDGVELELLDLKVNGEKYDDYQLTETGLYLNIDISDFELETTVKIKPDSNLSCEGLYKSGDIYCTQNEAQGFRKITYYLDRPDVMSSFTTTIIADKKFPYLLANGDKIDSGDIDGKHFSTWFDPHLKPSYLFAVVIGDLAKVQDKFTTKSGKEVSLEIYVDHGNEDKCDHAMRSLINSMKWDEDVFGLEYDLSTYMIVAVDSFNMGAMENKGLNIFNSSYVLAKKETATDANFQGIEAVIGHEYFHNWTGNRVTCRDWFQLTLKEGLTVFRDQEFSSDMLSRPVKRIDDVRVLKGHQFPEDAGPTSHPIKPKSYIEINNFYTATVYEKGAEIIRMIHTLLGEDNFRKGMDLYFKRHDGDAATTEDFLNAMSDASGINLNHFSSWYDQKGTPVVNVEKIYDSEKKVLTLNFEQEFNPDGVSTDSLYMPFHIGIYYADGSRVECDDKLILNKKQQSFSFENIKSDPIISLNDNFTAPVIVNFDYNKNDIAFLMANNTDAYNQYDACQKLYTIELKELILQYHKGGELRISDVFIEAFKKLLLNMHLDDSFKAYALSIPSEKDMVQLFKAYELEAFRIVRNFLTSELGKEFVEDFKRIFHSLDQKGEFTLTPEAMGKRALSAKCLSFLYSTATPEAIDLVYNAYNKATNMTDTISALTLLVSNDNPYRDRVSQDFYQKWKHEPLVIQKWFSMIVIAEDFTGDKIDDLVSLEAYDSKVPNFIRSVFRTFAAQNVYSFNSSTGLGYDAMAKEILRVDKFNPQIAAGLAKTLAHYKKLPQELKKLLGNQLEMMRSEKGISNDLYEIVNAIIEK